MIAISITTYSLSTKSKPASKNCCTPNCAQPDFDFVYDVSSRFTNTIKKSITEKATTAKDLLPAHETSLITNYYNLQVSTFVEDRHGEVRASSKSLLFTEDQLLILRNLDYTSSFFITGNVAKKTDKGLINDTLVYYMTVVPESPAHYQKGEKAFLRYLKKNSRNEIGIAEEDNTQPGKISFVITKEGQIDRVRLTFSCGYTMIDNRMLELILKAPGKWIAATDANGNSVDQELVFFFGKIGC